MKKEIERKFLLKSLPILPFHEIQHIIQHYYLLDNVWNRIRKINVEGNDPLFLHTIKTYKDNICYEEEKYIDAVEHWDLLNEIHFPKYESKCIIKNRYIYKTGIIVDFEGEEKEIKWEIDVFNFTLIMAELELPDLNFQIEIPEPIKKQLIYEVTGIKEFSNKFLSEPLKFYEQNQ